MFQMQLWRNWHTRMIQVHVHIRGFGFKSRQLHERALRDFGVLFFLKKDCIFKPGDED